MDDKALPNYIPQIDRTVLLCLSEDVDEHLSAFITVFVYPEFRARWKEFLIGRRPVWDRPNRSAQHIKLYWKACSLMDGFTPFEGTAVAVDWNKLPYGWHERTFGERTGPFFMPRMPACIVTPNEAHTIANFYDESCIFSLTPGKEMLFFQRDGAMYKSKVKRTVAPGHVRANCDGAEG